MWKTVAKIVLVVGSVGAFGLIGARAQTCKIEDYTYKQKAGRLYISGATTCSSGKIVLRVYDARNDEFLASDFTYIDGYAFQTYIDARVPAEMNLKYSIEPR